MKAIPVFDSDLKCLGVLHNWRESIIHGEMDPINTVWPDMDADPPGCCTMDECLTCRSLEVCMPKLLVAIPKGVWNMIHDPYWHNKGTHSPSYGKKGSNALNWRGGERTNSEGHVLLYRPEHPRAYQNGYVKRAIIVWEEANDQPFPEGKDAHHDSGVPDDDRPENIVPLTHGEHTTITNMNREYPHGYKKERRRI